METGCLLTVCLIVRNEEHCLGACLDSVKDWADQIVVVDTGSTDSTLQVARQYGAQIEYFKWTNDFAKARNYSLQFATGDWILVLDADERLASGTELLSALKDPSYEGYYLTIKSPLGVEDFVAEDHVVRLFRNHKGYEFTGAIHEQIAGSIKERKGQDRVGFSNIIINHIGYMPEEIHRKQKAVRNSQIIKSQLAERQEDVFLLYSLGTELIQQEQYVEAYNVATKALKNMNGSEGYFKEVLLLALMASLKNKTYAECEALFANALIMMPLDSDILFLSGLRQALLGNYFIAGEMFGKGGLNTVLVPPQLLYAIVGEIYYRQGIWQEAARAFRLSMQAAPSLYCTVRIIEVIRQGEIGAVEALADTGGEDCKRLIYEAAQKQDYHTAAVICLITIANDHKMAFKQWKSLYLSIITKVSSMPAVIKDYLDIAFQQIEICKAVLVTDQASQVAQCYLVKAINRSLGVWLTLWPEHVAPINIWECCL